MPNGEKPGDLPVGYRIQLTLNRNTVKGISLRASDAIGEVDRDNGVSCHEETHAPQQ
jgi:hypothetical protein